MQHLPEGQLILGKLKNDLPPYLLYHTIDHTMDVYDRALYMAKEEGIKSSDLKLLLIAALYHDAGYLKQSEDHEQISCQMVRTDLPIFNYSIDEIEKICTLIMATKIPQNPKSHLEEIIADADLDYLGRDDFFTIGDKLYLEFLELGKITTREQWNIIQINFLQQHHFFTTTAIKLRQTTKEKNLKILMQKSKTL
jgi:predicted metal-dependent HD superfamily phosphohydrolase